MAVPCAEMAHRNRRSPHRERSRKNNFPTRPQLRFILTDEARAESFAAAWDAALGWPVRKVAVHDLEFLTHHGLIRPVMFRGRYRGASRKIDVSALLRLARRLDGAGPDGW